ncbi:MAG TPA: protein kinase [Gemmatimonadaceae bacterium]|nr:protein kinase [Gemmatimonadaceae bacterium]
MTRVEERLAAVLADRYRIERELGAGGMATVYLAEDLKHHRRVAIKVLHAELSAVLGPERFLKEIELTARLQHPHILPLFDSGTAEGLLYYVMPFVEGETLRARLAREKQLPIADALHVASEVADALQYAHERGVVHRDIKPENVLLQNGHALVADFGIALAVEQAGGARMTQTGLSLGTPQYMSPEQAMGERDIGPRSDIYSLGAVTYEMLVGEPPFTGPNAQAIVAQVLTSHAPLASTHRRSVPESVDAAISTALEKLPADRFATAMEFASALRAPLPGARSRSHTSERERSSLRMPWQAIAGVAVGALVAVAWWLLHSRPERERVLRASLVPPPGCAFSQVATTNLIQLSPDGEWLAFVAICGTDESIWIHSLSTGERRQLPGTSHAAYPFWSPDGTSLGFFADGRLKRIDLRSNAVRDLAPAVSGRGGSWSATGVILYAPDIVGPLYEIPASGGSPTPATEPEQGLPEHTHRLPYFLPDGKHFLFADGPTSTLGGTVRVGELGTMRTRTLLDIPSNVEYADGWLFYTAEGLLMARPFDARTATFTGEAASLVPRLEVWPFRYIGNFTVSHASDLLAYRPAPEDHNRLEWFDPVTRTTKVVLEAGPYLHVRLSPDGRQALVEQREAESARRTLALYDIAAGTWNQIASPAAYYAFAWSPDGKEIVFNSAVDTVGTIISLDRTRKRTVMTHAQMDFLDWSRDSSFFIVQQQAAGSGFNMYKLDVGSLRKTVLLNTAADETSARLSPDGRLLAFVSNETGAVELYVTRMSDTGTKWRVSQAGVALDLSALRVPFAWSRTGHTLYFADAAGHLMSASIDDRPTVRIGRPAPVPGAPDDVVDLSTASDGRLLLLRSQPIAEAPLEIVVHWTAMSGVGR